MLQVSLISRMNGVKIILRTIAFLIGAAAACGAGIGAYREYCGGPIGVVPLYLIVVAMIAGVPLLISWWREFVHDPWVVPSAVFAACVICYGVSFADHIGLYEYGTGRGSPWLVVSLKVLGYLLISILSYVTATIVYHGTHSFLSSLGNAVSRKTQNS